jgi:hypothetical protein
MLLAQQIEGHMPHSSHIFGGMLLPNTGAVFIKRLV